VESARPDRTDVAQDEARLALRLHRRLGPRDGDDFSMETAESLRQLWRNTTGGVAIVMMVTTGMSLLVGGVVVMNMMLISVAERTFEIGLRRALGARHRDILRQILAESIVLTTVGGALGVILSAASLLALSSWLAEAVSSAFRASVPSWSIVLALLTSSAVGWTAGLYPAARAAGLDPVEALRRE
jgi:putative ABC transport system permease protein